MTEVRNWGGAHGEETVIPACGGAGVTTPCWRIVADPAQCPDTPGNLSIDVDRGGSSPPSGTYLHVQCVVD